MAGEDPDYSTRDLWQAIIDKDFPEWKLSVQIMPENEAETYHWHPFDLTKVWPHGDYPLHDVGVVQLNGNPSNYFAEVEQAAFEPSNRVPGIGFSPDKVLQNRLLSYSDAHRYRLGVNYDQIPVNQAKHAKVRTYHRDGSMRVDGNHSNTVNYEPNTYDGPMEDPAFDEPPLKIDGDAGRYNSYTCDDHDYYEQPRMFYQKTLDDNGRDVLIENLAKSLDSVPKDIQTRQLYHFYRVNKEFGEQLGEFLDVKIDDAIKAWEK